MTTSAPHAVGRWFQPSDTDPEAGMRLFLFPHAGSGASIYRDWPPLLPADITHQTVQLPGRQDRLGEAGFTEMEPLVEALCDAFVAEHDGRPYAFFGHCMGAQLAYRLTLALQERGEQTPLLIGASGWAPEGFLVVTAEQARMPEPELLGWIRSLGSVPKEIMDDPQALATVIPAMRADLEVVASYVDDGAAVRIPVVTYSGRSDQLMEAGAMDSWLPRTPDYLGNSEFQGDHFYINDNALPITLDLTRHMRRLAAAARR